MTIVEHDLEGRVTQQLVAVIDHLPPAPLGEGMAEMLMQSIPELARSADEDFHAGLVLSCVSNVTAIWELIRSGEPADSATPPAEAVAWSHEVVHRGVQLPALLRAYRLGHGLAARRVELVASELEMAPEIRWRVLARASTYFFAYIDAVCTALVDVYELERARWIRGAAAARAELVTAIIARQPVDPRAAGEKLRYDVSRRHLALIMWADPNEPADPAGALEAEVSTLAASLGGSAVLTIPIGERAVWAWTSGERLTDDPGSQQIRLADGLRAAIGTPATGLEGMAASHAEARAARRVAELIGLRTGSVAGYSEVGLTAVLTADPGEAVRFAEAELGELAAPTDGAARLRGTLRVYFDENLSPARAARRLSIHQNTVVYRVKRAEEILGRAVEERRLQLEVALRLAEGLDGLRAAAARGPVDRH